MGCEGSNAGNYSIAMNVGTEKIRHFEMENETLSEG